jgi:DNA-binding transcriptional LysR family regulator
MNLRQIDLNLLVIFDALMREKSVTRAALHIGVTQPAVSNALNRLRHLFKDELLVRTPTGMEPTQRAEELEPAVDQILRAINGLVDNPHAFDPQTSDLKFHIRLSDVLAFLLLPRLAHDIAAEAPAVHIETVHLSPHRTVEALESGAIDLAISTGLHGSSAVREQPLFDDRLICLSRTGHPRIGTKPNLEKFLSIQQIRVAQSPVDDRFVDNWLTTHGHRRLISLTVPHWLSVPHVVRETDLIAVMSQRAAERFAHDPGIQLSELPVPDCAFVWSLYWHKRHQSNPAQQWLRDRVANAAIPFAEDFVAS